MLKQAHLYGLQSLRCAGLAGLGADETEEALIERLGALSVSPALQRAVALALMEYGVSSFYLAKLALASGDVASALAQLRSCEVCLVKALPWGHGEEAKFIILLQLVSLTMVCSSWSALLMVCECAGTRALDDRKDGDRERRCASSERSSTRRGVLPKGS